MALHKHCRENQVLLGQLGRAAQGACRAAVAERPEPVRGQLGMLGPCSAVLEEPSLLQSPNHPWLPETTMLAFLSLQDLSETLNTKSRDLCIP